MSSTCIHHPGACWHVKRPLAAAEAGDAEATLQPTNDGDVCTKDDDDDWRTPHAPPPVHCPPGPKALALCTSAQCRSPNTPPCRDPSMATTPRNTYRHDDQKALVAPPPSTGGPLGPGIAHKRARSGLPNTPRRDPPTAITPQTDNSYGGTPQ